MKLEISAEIPYPRQRVFEVYRDKLPELVPYLPNVRSITVTSRKDEQHVVNLINRWKGGGEIPATVRKFLSEDLLEWDDYATWNDQELTCEWKTVVPAIKEAVSAWGKNRFFEVGGKTRLEINGEITVDASKVKLVPRMLAGVVGPAIEGFLVANIRPNLLAVSKGVEKYLDANK